MEPVAQDTVVRAERPAPKAEPAAETAAEAWRRRGHTVALAIPVKPPRKTKKK